MISVNNLTVRYGKFTAVNNVSFTVEHGEIVAILGPNGAGKSSIIKSIVGIVEYEGEIKILGRDAKSVEAKKPVRLRCGGGLADRPSHPGRILQLRGIRQGAWRCRREG